MDINAQVDMDYSLAYQGIYGVEQNDGTMMFKTMTSDKARETISGISQIGDMQITNEGENYKSDSRMATYNTEFNWEKWTNGITITEEERDDRIVSAKLSEARYLLISGKRTINQHTLDLFNYAFTAQSSLPNHLTFYGDGVPFCSTLHPVKGTGGTQSNASATGLPLTANNLQAAKIALGRQTGDRGELLRYGSSNLILLVPDALEDEAIRITKSKLRPGTANNDVNIFDGASITVVSTKLIGAGATNGSDTQWFLIDSMFSPCIFGERRPLTIGAPYMDDGNKNITVDISARYKIGPRDFRGVWGSKGDGASYSS